MLNVILTILKILGIILLVILGLILLILVTVLFVPVRYRSKGFVEKTDEGIDDNVWVKVTWLLRLISVRFELNGNKPELTVRIFGKKLNLFNNSKPAKEKKEKSAKNPSAITKEALPNESTMVKHEVATNKTLTDEAVTDDNITADEVIKEKKSFKQKILDILEKIKNIFEKIKHINSIKNLFIEYLKREESKLAIRFIKDIIFGAVRHILPQKFRASVWFGFEDPATTGNVLGILSIFYGIYGKNIDLNPNFEKEVLKFEYELKGRVRVFTLLRAALRIYGNKWIKDFITFSKETIKKED